MSLYKYFFFVASKDIRIHVNGRWGSSNEKIIVQQLKWTILWKHVQHTICYFIFYFSNSSTLKHTPFPNLNTYINIHTLIYLLSLSLAILYTKTIFCPSVALCVSFNLYVLNMCVCESIFICVYVSVSVYVQLHSSVLC